MVLKKKAETRVQIQGWQKADNFFFNYHLNRPCTDQQKICLFAVPANKQMESHFVANINIIALITGIDNHSNELTL
jgi:hypothetical protein